MRRTVLLIALTGLGGCAQLSALLPGTAAPGTTAPGALTDPVAPADSRVTTAPPPPTATTAAEFDTTTDAERAAAQAMEDVSSGTALGATIVSLGDPADPGLWIATPLVTAVTPGRVEVVATGETINLELRPRTGETGTGSEMSLPALRLLGVSLTDLTPMRVFALQG